MTRARALKQVIRARAAKTGERYTTARRHILRELNQGARSAQGSQAATPVPAKGGLSDAKAIEKTGHDLAHWFAILDRFGGIEKGHTASAKMLYERHAVPAWYCQGIVVAYERARGKRVMNQRCDGSYEVTVSKTMPATPARIITALKNTPRWSDGVDHDLLKALSSAITDRRSKGFVIRDDGQARFRYKWNGTIVQFNMYPKGPAKTAFVVSNTKLQSAASVETSRAKWKAACGALSHRFEEGRRSTD
jgi:hypothetical protein